jgi:hypothetical protein
MIPGGAAVIGVDDGASKSMAAELSRLGVRVVPISVKTELSDGVSAPEGVLLDNGKPVCDLKDFPHLPGKHNWQNACAVYAAARAEGIPAKAIVAGLATYPGLAHRQELIATSDGIAWVNDSKATNADAVEKALVCYDHVYWIAGGQAKEGGIKALEKHFDRIEHAFLIGDFGGVRRCSILRDAQSVSNSCSPVAVRLRRPKRRSVNSLPLSVSIVRMRIGQARSRSRKKRRALAAVLALKMRMKTQRVARSMATNRYRREVSSAIWGRYLTSTCR